MLRGTKNTSTVERLTLDNGLTVLLENIPHRTIATVGLWLPVGSRFEKKTEAGYSHFVEHMLFKGTQRRSYTEISRAIDRLGGYMNASTGKEMTEYYVGLSGRHLPIALDVLADMFFDSQFKKEEFASEKKVILEELKMTEDQPDDYLFEFFYENVMGNNSMGRSVGGYVSTISRCTRDALYEYYHSHYGPTGTVLSLAGALWTSPRDKKNLIAEIKRHFERHDHSLRGKPGYDAPGFADPEFQAQRTPKQKHFAHKAKDLEQVNFVLSLPGLPSDPDQPADLQVLTHYLGGTMSSRLFIELREKKGLCYSISTFHSQFLREGVWGIFCATSPEKYATAVATAIDELASLTAGIDAGELEESKSGLKGSIELGMENSYRRASYNARSWLYYGKLYDWRDYLRRVEQVTPTSFISAAKQLWRGISPTIIGLGPTIKAGTRAKLQKLISSPLFH